MLVYLSSDGSDYMTEEGVLPIGFHAFVTLYNNECNERDITILPDFIINVSANTSITFSKWFSKTPDGIYINQENLCFTGNTESYKGIVSLQAECSLEKLDQLSSFFIDYRNDALYYDNAAQFAVDLWNFLSEKSIICKQELITPAWLTNYIHHKKKVLGCPLTKTNSYYFIERYENKNELMKESVTQYPACITSSFTDETAMRLYRLTKCQYIQRIVYAKTKAFISNRTQYQMMVSRKDNLFPMQIELNYTAWIDGIGLRYGEDDRIYLGACTGIRHLKTLAVHEYITKVKICTNGKIISDIIFLTSLGQEYAGNGYVSKDETYQWHEAEFPEGYGLVYMEEENNSTHHYINTLVLYGALFEEGE